MGARSAERLTVQQLEEILEQTRHVSGAPEVGLEANDLLAQITREDSLAPRLAQLELLERLTPDTQDRLIARFKLGPLTQSALELLADRSALLDPPAKEMPDFPPPDHDAQTQMIQKADQHIFEMLSHLPDFFALLTTTHFDDGPIALNGQVLVTEPSLHLIGASTREITFSQGREIFDSSQPVRSGRAAGNSGLQSQGEFGAEAAMVLLDVKKGTLAFAHWELAGANPVAVFRYTVPGGASHYQVRYSCGSRPAFHQAPPYHGTLSIDPSMGVLVRFTVQTEWKPGDPITHVSSVIEYGPVQLGPRRYYCPRRSLAFTTEEADFCGHGRHESKLTRPVAMLNRIVFSDYHRLGTDVQIVPGSVKALNQEDGTKTEAPERFHEPEQPNAHPASIPPHP